MADISQISISNLITNNVNSLNANLIKDFKTISDKSAIESMSELGDINGGLNFFVNRNDFNNITSYQKLNTNLQNKLNAIDQILDTIIDLASDSLHNLMQLNSSSGSTMQYDNVARNQLETIQSQLNQSFQGKYLFSGVTSNVKPVEDLLEKTNVISGQATNNYYKGSIDTDYSYINDSLKLEYGIKADDPAFVHMIASLNLSIGVYEGTTFNATKYNQSVTLMNQSMEQLISLRSQLGNNMQLLSNQMDIQKRQTLYYQEQVENILSIDFPLAIAKMHDHQNTLEAAFQVIARMKELSLTKFI